MFPKDKPFRSEKYLKWIRSLPCCVTGATENVVAHHITNTGRKGTGTKTNDYYCIPLEQISHQMLHANPRQWEKEFGSQKHYWEITIGKAIREGVFNEA